MTASIAGHATRIGTDNRQSGDHPRATPQSLVLPAPARTVPEDCAPAQQFVADDSLTYCVAQARKALGDSGHAQRCIKTVHGRGYRFIASVNDAVDAESSPVVVPPPQRTGIWAAVALISILALSAAPAPGM